MNCIITFKVTVNGIVADDDCLKHATTLKMTITPYWLGRPASGGWPQSTPCRSRARPSPPTPAACSGRCHAGTWEGGAAQTAQHITISLTISLELSTNLREVSQCLFLVESTSQPLWVWFWDPENVPSSCTHLGPAQVMEVIIIDV